MELFLNLCWLALLLPAYLLWQQRVSSADCSRRSLLVIGALACALMLLFPVISVSDDLHATSQAIEESKRSFRQGAPRACSAHCIAHVSPAIAPASASLPVSFQQVGSIQLFPVHSPQASFASASAGRSPPVAL